MAEVIDGINQPEVNPHVRRLRLLWILGNQNNAIRASARMYQDMYPDDANSPSHQTVAK